MLDTFNENLIQAFSVRHLSLKPHYASCIKFGKVVPDYGYWLYYKNALAGGLPRATPWLKAVHNLRVKVDLAHAKDQKSGIHTRQISFQQAETLFKGAQLAWAELIGEWIKIL